MLEDWRSRNPKKLLPMEHVMEAARRREQRGKGARGGGGGGGERFAMRSGRELYRGMLAGELSACAVLTHRNADDGVEPVYVAGFGAIGAAVARGGGGGGGAAAREPATIDFAGGINLPKIVECIGSDGSVSKQLVKGKDDLRQDAVMQQVFTLVNVLLRRDVAARKRALHMRAYRVVPLAPTAGVLQWVDNTMPVSSWLVKGHERHRPSSTGDWSNQECRNTMSAARKMADTMAPAAAAAHLLKEYQRVTKHFHPVTCSPLSPLYLPYISTIFPLYLPYIFHPVMHLTTQTLTLNPTSTPTLPLTLNPTSTPTLTLTLTLTRSCTSSSSRSGPILRRGSSAGSCTRARSPPARWSASG